MCSKAWLAARASLRLARMPRLPAGRSVSPCSARASGEALRATLAGVAAAPVLFAHAFGPFYMKRTWGVGGVGKCVSSMRF